MKRVRANVDNRILGGLSSQIDRCRNKGDIAGLVSLAQSASRAGASTETLRDVMLVAAQTAHRVLDALFEQTDESIGFQSPLNNQKVQTIIQARRVLEIGHRLFGVGFDHDIPCDLAFRLADIFADPKLHPNSYDIDGIDHPYFSVGAYKCTMIGIQPFQAKNLERLGVCLIRFGEPGRRKFCDAILPFAKPRTNARVLHDQVAAGGFYSYDQKTRVQFHVAATGPTRRQRFWNAVGCYVRAANLGYIGHMASRA